MVGIYLQAAAVEEGEGGVTAFGVIERTFSIGAGIPGAMALRIALVEAVVHGWDIARATGQAYSIPDDLAGPMLEGLRKQLGGGERAAGSPFVSEVAIPDDAPLQDRLIAFTGRTP